MTLCKSIDVFQLNNCACPIISHDLYIFTPCFSAVYNQEQFQIKSGLWWRVYGIYIYIYLFFIFFWNEIFFISKKITSVGSSTFHKNYNDWIKCKLSKSQTKWTGLTTGSANTCKFFENEKILISKKITTMGSKHHSPVHLVWDLESLHLIQSL